MKFWPWIKTLTLELDGSGLIKLQLKKKIVEF